ncbi:uncharacterized protein LAJ45_01142 [Morchella importuna]|uniref:uncharacterized protein n=1 Tax=Morchella importuna TaxID=1174673 RepID=UPI001E8D64FC|nr:uncharacterized protein LAJ45_01142 [Morchella importuna]KAH8154614.1 hypothetical protein LAJ45_01142 [Morchella importuna]
MNSVKPKLRWEEIVQFVPRTNSGPPYKQPNFMTKHSWNDSSTLLVIPKKKPQFQFDPTKYFELPRPMYKSPVIVYSTPPDDLPPRPRGRSATQGNGVLNLDMPQTTRPEAHDVVPAVSSSILPDHSRNTTESGSKPVEKDNSPSTVIHSPHLKICEDDTFSAALAEETVLTSSDESLNNNKHVAIVTYADQKSDVLIHEMEERVQDSKLPVLLERGLLESQSSSVGAEIPSESSSSTQLPLEIVDLDVEKDIKEVHPKDEEKDKNIHMSADSTSLGPVSSPDITPKSTFYWADDVIDEEEAQPTETFTWMEQVTRYTRHITPKSDLSDVKGPQIAEVITPAHGYFTGRRRALVLTTVGIGADIFTSWDNTIMRTRKKKLSVILEEPVSGLKGFFSNREEFLDNCSMLAEVKRREVIYENKEDKVGKADADARSLCSGIGVHDLLTQRVYIQVEETSSDEGVSSAAFITGGAGAKNDILPQTATPDIAAETENAAINEYIVTGEDTPKNCEVSKTAVVNREWSLVFLLLLITLGLFQIMP